MDIFSGCMHTRARIACMAMTPGQSIGQKPEAQETHATENVPPAATARAPCASGAGPPSPWFGGCRVGPLGVCCCLLPFAGKRRVRLLVGLVGYRSRRRRSRSNRCPLFVCVTMASIEVVGRIHSPTQPRAATEGCVRSIIRTASLFSPPFLGAGWWRRPMRLALCALVCPQYEAAKRKKGNTQQLWRYFVRYLRFLFRVNVVRKCAWGLFALSLSLARVCVCMCVSSLHHSTRLLACHEPTKRQRAV